MNVRDARTDGDRPQEAAFSRADVLFDAMQRYARAIFVSALVGLAIGALTAILTDRHATAAASIFVDPANARVASDSAAVNTLAREAALLESLGSASGLRALDVAVEPDRRLLRVSLRDTTPVRKLQDLLDAYFASRGRTAEAQVSTVRPPQLVERPRGTLVAWTAVCGLAGMLAGLAAAMTAISRDRTFRSTDSLARTANVSVVLPIPPLSNEHLFILRSADTRPGEADVASFEAALHAMSGTDYVGAPAFRQSVLRLLARLRARAKPGRPHVVMLAAPKRGAGNTTLAIALAEASALAAERVLLIDSTVANPAMRREGQTCAGLEDGKTEINRDALSALIEHDDPTSFSTLPLAASGLIRPDVTERRRLVAALNALVQDFDLIFIDAGGIAEDEAAASLSPLADQIWFVTRYAVTRPNDVVAVEDLLVPVRDRIAGAVLTMAPDF